MANVLSLAMKINADASGFKLDPVQRALKSLGDETTRVSSVFDKFADTSEAAAKAQAETTRQLDELTKARLAGTITAEEFAKQFAAIEKAAKDEAAALGRAAQITEANLTPTQRYERALAELNNQLKAGRISQETYDRAVAKTRATLDSTTSSVNSQKLQFNELSGIFSALPGPLGNIAGRISGIASAGEGLGRIFSGGLSQGISGVASSLTQLITPANAAIAGIAALGTAAVAITNGLIQLEDRVEKLGNTADKLGISFEFVQVLDEAARRSGTSIDAVSGAFGRLQKSVLGVDEESKAAQKALSEIGVTAQQLQELQPQEQYRLIAQRVGEIEDPARRTATAVALFGRSGADLVPFFNNIKSAADDFERVGNALSDAQRRQIDEFGGSMDRLGVATRGAKEQLLAELAPAATQAAGTLSLLAGAVAKNSGPISAGLSAIANAYTGGLPAALSAVNLAVSTFDKNAQASSESVGKVAESVGLTAEQAAELAKAFAASDKALDNAINKAGEFGQAGFDAALQFQEALDELQTQANDKELNAEQYARGVANATAEYERQIDAVRRAADETKRLSEESARRAEQEAKATQSIIDSTLERIRIEQDFNGDAARAKNANDLNRVREEIAKTEAAIAAANAASDTEAASRAAARLAQLDQVKARLEDAESTYANLADQAAELADQAAQGFSDGFDKAFQQTNAGLNDLISKAGEFGNEGAIAAQQLQDGITRAQEQVRAGILSQPAYEAEVAAQRRIAEARLGQLDSEAKARQEQINANFQQQVAANERLNQFMLGQMTEQQRAEAAAVEESFSRRRQAVENLKAIEDRIALQRKAVEAAREQNDLKAAKARNDELKSLRQLQRQERAIAEGKATTNQQINKAANTAAQAQLAQQQIISQTAQKQIETTRAAANDAVTGINNAFAAAADRQRELFRRLNTLGSRVVQTADVRTAEGAALVLGLAATAQDPQLIEQRMANKLLRQIVGGLANNLNRIGVGAALL